MGKQGGAQGAHDCVCAEPTGHSLRGCSACWAVGTAAGSPVPEQPLEACLFNAPWAHQQRRAFPYQTAQQGGACGGPGWCLEPKACRRLGKIPSTWLSPRCPEYGQARHQLQARTPRPSSLTSLPGRAMQAGARGPGARALLPRVQSLHVTTGPHLLYPGCVHKQGERRAVAVVRRIKGVLQEGEDVHCAVAATQSGGAGGRGTQADEKAACCMADEPTGMAGKGGEAQGAGCPACHVAARQRLEGLCWQLAAPQSRLRCNGKRSSLISLL